MSQSESESELSTESFAEREAHRMEAERQAIEELERAKTKAVAFAVRANYSFDSMMCSEEVPLESHMISFAAKEFLHIKAPYNADWWIGRAVRIGCDLGFLPSPSKMMAMRYASNQQQQQQQQAGGNYLNDDKNGPFSPGEELKGAGDDENCDENGINGGIDDMPDETYDGPLGLLSSVRRGVPEEPSLCSVGHDMEIEGGYDSGGNGGDDSGDNDTKTPLPTIKRSNILSFAAATAKVTATADSSTLAKRRIRLRKADILPPYEVVPCMRPVIFIGPALKGYEVTDMMQKAIFENLNRRFEGRIFVAHVSVDISQARRNNQTAGEKKMMILDRGRQHRASSQTQVQQEVERIFELASTMQLVVLDCDTINHPSQVVKTPLAPQIIYLKIGNTKVLSKLIKSRGKTQRKNAGVQMSAADKLILCPPEMFDLVIEQSNLDSALEKIADFLESYWAATHPPSSQTKSKTERILGAVAKPTVAAGGANNKRPLDAVTVEMLTQLGAAGGANLLLNTGPTDPRVTEGLGGGGDQSLLLWGGEPEAYRSDREMRFDQQNRSAGVLDILPVGGIAQPTVLNIPPVVGGGGASVPPVAVGGVPSSMPQGGTAAAQAAAARPAFNLVQPTSRRGNNATTASGALRDPRNQTVFASRSARQSKQRQEEMAAQQEQFNKDLQKKRNLARKQHREQQQH